MCPCADTTTTVTTTTSAAAVIRPLLAGEEHLVREVFDGLSSDARYLRFHTPTPRLTDAALRSLATVEKGVRGAMVALVGGHAVGLAQWARDPARPQRAELAMAVADAHQGRGNGRALLTRIAEEVAAHGIDELVCHVHHENARVGRMLRRLGARRAADGVLVVPVALLNGEARAMSAVLLWTDAVPGPRTPAGGR